LCARHGDDPGPVLSLSTALKAGDDPFHVLPYLAGLGLPVRQLDDLLAINAAPDEEDLHAWRCHEGIAVSIASDGVWLLFTP
jgi:hypothetical protein